MALFPTYNRFPVAVQSAEGTVVTDINGKKYIDMGSGIGVTNLGHQHPEVKKAVTEQLDAYWHVSNLYENPIQETVAKNITENSVGDYVFFSNSGAEANEAAIKLARKATGKEKIVTFDKSFHGRTFATMAATGQDKVRIGFGPMLEKFAYATYNDFDSVQAAVDEDTAAVMLELVQGEGGVVLAEQQFIDDVAALCEKKNILLIIDEIQTGMGRTGTKFAYEQFGIEPDIFTLAKGLGNGVPVGAMVAKEKWGEFFGPGSHGSTFGGNPIAMAAAKSVTSIIFETAFLKEVEEKAAYLAELLDENIAPINGVKEIRQKGLMIGIEHEKAVGPFVKTLIENGVLVLNAGENVLRLLPPLTVSKEELKEAVEAIKQTLEG